MVLLEELGTIALILGACAVASVYALKKYQSSIDKYLEKITSFEKEEDIESKKYHDLKP